MSGPTTDYGSLLDHVYTDVSTVNVSCHPTECFYSDHKPITVAVQFE